MFRPVACLCAVLLLAEGSTSGEPDGPFVALVRSVKSDSAASVRALLRLSRHDISTGVRECLAGLDAPPHGRRCSRRELMAAAMLLADAAGATIVTDHELAEFYLRTGADALKPLTDEPSGPSDTAIGTESAFVPRWYSYAAGILLTQRYVEAAFSMVRDGLSRYPRSADLYLARGIIMELPFFDPSFPRILHRTTVGSWLQPAANDYLHALRLEPTHARARLRLAWTRLAVGDSRAVADTSIVLRQASDDDTRYLAHLLRAAIAERSGMVADAIAEYDAAQRLGPGYQSACIGLSHAHTVSGDVAAAARTANACLSLVPDEEHPDPWLFLRFGATDTSVIEWLHLEAWGR